MPAASMSIMRSTLLREAYTIPTRPPKEWPASTGFFICSCAARASISRVYSSTPQTSAGSADFPKPGKSTVYTRLPDVAAIRLTIATVSAVHPHPCITIIGLPSPCTVYLKVVPQSVANLSSASPLMTYWSMSFIYLFGQSVLWQAHLQSFQRSEIQDRQDKSAVSPRHPSGFPCIGLSL